MTPLTQTMQTVLWYFNTAFNVLEFFIIIWVIRDRRVLVTSLKRLAETVHALSHSQTQPPTTQPAIKSVKPVSPANNPATKLKAK